MWDGAREDQQVEEYIIQKNEMRKSSEQIPGRPIMHTGRWFEPVDDLRSRYTSFDCWWQWKRKTGAWQERIKDSILQPEGKGINLKPEISGHKATTTPPITTARLSVQDPPISIPNEPEVLRVCFPQATASATPQWRQIHLLHLGLPLWHHKSPSKSRPLRPLTSSPRR